MSLTALPTQSGLESDMLVRCSPENSPANRSEQPFRTGIWFSMNGFAQIFGGLIAYGIGYINAAIPS
jgi:hypothetical protein